MNFGILAAGAAKGLGEGLKDLGKQWREDDIRAENHRMEMEKEKRLEEANIRSEGRQQGYTKEAEQRAIANRAITAQQDIDIANKPENVQAKANAEKTLAQAKIDVELDPNNTAKKLALKQAELDMQAASQIKVHNATIDYQGRDIQHKLNNLEIQAKEAELKGMPKDARSAVTAYLDQAKALQLQAASLDVDSAARADLNTQIREAHASANSILQRYGFGASKEANQDPLQINNSNQKETSKTTDTSSVVVPQPEKTKEGIIEKQARERLVNQIDEKTKNVNFEYDKNAPVAKLQEILFDLNSREKIEPSNPNRKLKPVVKIVGESAKELVNNKSKQWSELIEESKK
jgi:hypothetical protein